MVIDIINFNLLVVVDCILLVCEVLLLKFFLLYGN